jgi:DNA repair protein RecO (recombination protein O)
VIRQSIGLYRAQGIVLHAIRLGEADRIVTIYTQSHGRLRGVAKGARKSRSRFGARLDAFTHVDLLLYRGRSDLDVITQAEILGRPKRLRADYAAFCAASAMADAVERTTPERERNVRLFLLLRSGLEALEAGANDPPLLAYAFLAKLASMAGLHPTLGICVECGNASRIGFSFGRGGAVCGACIERADPKISDELLDAWSLLMAEEWSELRVRDLSKQMQRELGGLILAFTQWHTEAKFRAFGVLASAAR